MSMIIEQQYKEAQEIVDTWKKQHRKPLQGDYYEGMNDKDTINPRTGLTWGEQYQMDLARWNKKYKNYRK